MIALLSPAKTLDFDVRNLEQATLPVFLNQASAIAEEMRTLGLSQLEQLLNLSYKLASQAAHSYAQWRTEEHVSQGKPAILVYRGNVYQGLQADDLSAQELDFAQRHLRVLSGLYGVLRPFDLILPYRLEMATKLGVAENKDLYQFWTGSITAHLQQLLAGERSGILINLASDEYAKAIGFRNLKTRVIQPVFQEYSQGKYKVISMYAKRARGLMTRFIIKNAITVAEDLKLFDSEGYHYMEPLSDVNRWIFTRG